MKKFKTFLLILYSGMKTFRIFKLLILSENNYSMPTETIITVSKYLTTSLFAVAVITRIMLSQFASLFKMVSSKNEGITWE